MSITARASAARPRSIALGTSLGDGRRSSVGGARGRGDGTRRSGQGRRGATHGTSSVPAPPEHEPSASMADGVASSSAREGHHARVISAPRGDGQGPPFRLDMQMAHETRLARAWWRSVRVGYRPWPSVEEAGLMNKMHTGPAPPDRSTGRRLSSDLVFCTTDPLSRPLRTTHTAPLRRLRTTGGSLPSHLTPSPHLPPRPSQPPTPLHMTTQHPNPP